MIDRWLRLLTIAMTGEDDHAVNSLGDSLPGDQAEGEESRAMHGYDFMGRLLVSYNVQPIIELLPRKIEERRSDQITAWKREGTGNK
jgi:hypothetical protein